MKKKSHIFLTMIIALSSFSSVLSTYSDRRALEKSTEQHSSEWIEQKLMCVLTQIVTSKRYWIDIADQSIYRTITRPLHHWIHFSWETEIDEHLSYLEDLQHEVAIALTNHIKGIKPDKKDVYAIISQADLILRQHGMPLHPIRNWAFYAIATLALYKTYNIINNYLNNHVQFEFSPKTTSEPIDKAFLYIENNPHKLINLSDRLIVTCHVDHEKKLTEELERQGLTMTQREREATTYTTRPAQFTDFKLTFVNQEGQFLGTVFFNNCLLNPIKSIIQKLQKKEDTNTIPEAQKRLMQQEVKNAWLKIFYAAAHEQLSDGAPKYPKIHNEYTICKGNFDHLPIAKLDEMRKDLGITLPDVARSAFASSYPLIEEKINDLKHYFETNTGTNSKLALAGINSLEFLINKYMSPTSTSVSQLSPTGTLNKNKTTDKGVSPSQPNTKDNAQEIKTIEKNSIAVEEYLNVMLKEGEHLYTISKEKGNIVLDALGYAKDAFMLTPTLLATYVAAALTTRTLQWKKNKYFKEPLRSDLKDFVNFLHHSINNGENDPMFEGCYYYWISRIKSYLPYMSKKDKMYFLKDLDNVMHTSNLEEKIRTLEVILYDEMPHY